MRLPRRGRGLVSRIRTRVRATVTFCILTLYCLVAIYAIHPVLPFNALRLPYETTINVQLWLPQGWAFFTRDPQEDLQLIYVKRRGREWTRADMRVLAESSGMLGFGRSRRAQNMEASILLAQIPRQWWKPCRGSVQSCLDRAPFAGEIRNPSPQPTILGECGAIVQKPIPWAWSRSNPPITMPCRVVRFRVVSALIGGEARSD